MDYAFTPAGKWRYALDPSSFTFENAKVDKLPSPIFDAGRPPTTISAKACEVEWALDGDMFAAPPPENPECVGEEKQITLWPYGVCPSIYP